MPNRSSTQAPPHRQCHGTGALRFALTEHCNFKCVFCHNEGLGSERHRPADDALADRVLLDAVESGYTDFTFTGGEPLLRKPRLERSLRLLSALPQPPDVTLVTNGALLDAPAIELLVSYSGAKKVHISLHAADGPTHSAVTQTPPRTFRVVCDNIRATVGAGLAVTLNAVLLYGKTSGPESVKAFIDLATDLGVARVKFIEFMVIEANEAERGLFHDKDVVTTRLEGMLGVPPQHAQPGRVRFELPGKRLSVIEVQSCLCQIGCDRCLELRQPAVDSQLKYHPCFVHSQEKLDVEPGRFAEAIARGDAVIAEVARRNPGSSPTLFKRDAIVAEKSEVYFGVTELDANGLAAPLGAFLTTLGAAMVRVLDVSEEFFRPARRLEHWDDWSRVLKISSDRENDLSSALVYSDLRYDRVTIVGVELVRVTTQFLFPDGPLVFPDSKLPELLGRLDFERFLALRWTIDRYVVRTKAGTPLELSLGRSITTPTRLTVKVNGSAEMLGETIALLRQYSGRWEALSVPVWQWLAEPKCASIPAGAAP